MEAVMLEEKIIPKLASHKVDEWRSAWDTAKPFHFVVIDDFLEKDFAEALLREYPPADPTWTNITYTHQKKKFSLTRDFPPSINEFFGMSASKEFLDLISEITGVDGLLADPDLVGGGCHQIVNGGFLDVHIDFNVHSVTRNHRQLNAILYLNKNWKEEYAGFLELWDMQRKARIANIAPLFNRLVIFETNEISYHGHPVPLNISDGMSRKSLAVYYYTVDRPAEQIGPEHNTVYMQTTGITGYVKTAVSSFVAARERIAHKGLRQLASQLKTKLVRRMNGLPPQNG
jgi:Rps23 Pro-64 3,4-dihydroxylase Tpa1-like proline 4-hydroxylase